MLVQLAGAVLGALLCKALLTDEGSAVNYGATSVAQSSTARRSRADRRDLGTFG